MNGAGGKKNKPQINTVCRKILRSPGNPFLLNSTFVNNLTKAIIRTAIFVLLQCKMQSQLFIESIFTFQIKIKKTLLVSKESD